jgi:hypothetical protein
MPRQLDSFDEDDLQNLATNGDLTAAFELGLLYAQQGRHDDAVVLFEGLATNRRADRKLRNNAAYHAGLTLIQLRRYDEAAVLLENLANDPRADRKLRNNAAYHAAAALVQLGRDGDAIPLLEQAANGGHTGAMELLAKIAHKR